MKLKTLFGQPAWQMRSDLVECAVTRQGGHLAPVVFDRKRRRIQLFHISPFWKEEWGAEANGRFLQGT